MLTNCRMCNDCKTVLIGFNSHGFCCENCGQWFCERCASCTESRALYDTTEEDEGRKKLCKACDVKVYEGSDLVGECYDSSYASPSDHLLSRYQEEEAGNYGQEFLFASDYYHDSSGRVSERDDRTFDALCKK